MVVCPGCTQTKLHEAKGMCQICYDTSRRRAKGIKPPVRTTPEAQKLQKKITSKALYEADKRKHHEHGNRWRRTNRIRHLKLSRLAHIKREFGLEPWEYRGLLRHQAGLCAVCCEPMIPGATCVDHCHRTGKVRGLLCHSCNTSLGRLQDCAALVFHAAEYLCAHAI